MFRGRPNKTQKKLYKKLLGLTTKQGGCYTAIDSSKWKQLIEYIDR